MDELYDDLTAEFVSLYVQGIIEIREWRFIDFIYIFIVDYKIVTL
jgi:hypothetical protein